MNRQQLIKEITKLVVLGNHPECETYDEALELEKTKFPCTENYRIVQSWTNSYLGWPVDSSRLMQAIEEVNCSDNYISYTGGAIGIITNLGFSSICGWKLTINGKTCTLEEQTDETLNAIHKLLTE